MEKKINEEQEGDFITNDITTIQVHLFGEAGNCIAKIKQNEQFYSQAQDVGVNELNKKRLRQLISKECIPFKYKIIKVYQK
ncbi:unnamed protein product [Paramecium octaurelia]|uniref:Uncharacterized protein n=1 Tax=Paramecium octaurelia TaxID=43137 RepID=A0A8S1UWJ5_PAROT|nr:unnamed protein product [Paramecium octaurelia]